jgi:hypothetical protein
MLATAEMHVLELGGVVFYRRKSASLVAAVAKGLAGALAAGTPVITFAGFYIDVIGTFLGNLWFWHKNTSYLCDSAVTLDSALLSCNSDENPLTAQRFALEPGERSRNSPVVGPRGRAGAFNG